MKSFSWTEVFGAWTPQIIYSVLSLLIFVDTHFVVITIVSCDIRSRILSLPCDPDLSKALERLVCSLPFSISLLVHLSLLLGIWMKSHRALQPWLMIGLPLIMVNFMVSTFNTLRHQNRLVNNLLSKNSLSREFIRHLINCLDHDHLALN